MHLPLAEYTTPRDDDVVGSRIQSTVQADWQTARLVISLNFPSTTPFLVPLLLFAHIVTLFFIARYAHS
jgi:hypothetical protein